MSYSFSGDNPVFSINLFFNYYTNFIRNFHIFLLKIVGLYMLSCSKFNTRDIIFLKDSSNNQICIIENITKPL